MSIHAEKQELDVPSYTDDQLFELIKDVMWKRVQDSREWQSYKDDHYINENNVKKELKNFLLGAVEAFVSVS
jgi:hypothetical protein